MNEIYVETGLTTGLLEDVPPFQKHPFIMQAEQFLKGAGDPATYYDAVRENLTRVPGAEHGVALRLLTTIELAIINTADAALKLANDARKGGNTKATKPRELYVRYAPALEAIIERGKLDPMAVYRKVRDGAEDRDRVKPPLNKELIWTSTAIQAKSVLHDLYTSTSLSEGDLTNPDWIDPYTKQAEIQAADASDYFDQLIQHDPSVTPMEAFFKMLKWDTNHRATDTPVVVPMSTWEKEVRRHAEHLKQKFNWTVEMVQAWIQAQMGGFDAESDDILLPDDDDRTYTPPTLEEKELVLNRPLWWGAREAVSNFHTARGTIFTRMKAKGVRGRDWHPTFRSLLVKEGGYKDLLGAIEKVAAEDIVTAAAIYLSLAADYGLLEEDVQGIFGALPNAAESGSRMALLDFANAWEDDLLSITQDALSPTSETSPHSLPDEYQDSIVEDNDGKPWIVLDAPVRSSMPMLHPNPARTAAYNIGYTRAMLSGASLPQAEQAAMRQWREEMDARASRLYDKVLAQTGSQRKAMTAFWNACDPIVPRPQEKIAGILPDRSGVRLASGRPINWGIFVLKLRKKELDLTDKDGNDVRERLLNKLTELGVAPFAYEHLKA